MKTFKTFVEERDLDAAIAARKVSGKSHTCKCLLAQFAQRITGKEVTGSTPSAACIGPEDQEYSFSVVGMHDLVHNFDKACDELIRKQLPREVEVTY